MWLTVSNSPEFDGEIDIDETDTGFLAIVIANRR
jgi:hypothetical protein